MQDERGEDKGSEAGEDRVEVRLLAEDPVAIGLVIRWVSSVLASPRFWRLRSEWADLTQETVARVLESLRSGRFDLSRDLRPWVQGIARNTALQALEQRSRTLPFEAEHEDRIVIDNRTEKHVISVQLVTRAMDLLSADCRALIKSYYFDDRNYAEIASTMGIPEGTVKSRLFRCLESACRIVRERGHRTLRGLAGRRASKPRTPGP